MILFLQALYSSPYPIQLRTEPESPSVWAALWGYQELLETTLILCSMASLLWLTCSELNLCVYRQHMIILMSWCSVFLWGQNHQRSGMMAKRLSLFLACQGHCLWDSHSHLVWALLPVYLSTVQLVLHSPGSLCTYKTKAILV